MVMESMDLDELEDELQTARDNATALEKLSKKEFDKALLLEQALKGFKALRELSKQKERAEERRQEIEDDFKNSSRAERGGPKRRKV